MSVPATAETPPAPTSKTGKPLKITRQVRTAIEAMVWQGLKREDAANHAGMKDNSLYVALRRPDVKAFYLAECEVLRTSGKARRIHRLNAMVEQDDNKAAVINAAMALERINGGDSAGASSTSAAPGVVIQILTPAAQQQFKTIDIEPVVMKSDG